MLLHDTAIPSIDLCVSMRLFFATYEELLEKQGWITTVSAIVFLVCLFTFCFKCDTICFLRFGQGVNALYFDMYVYLVNYSF